MLVWLGVFLVKMGNAESLVLNQVWTGLDKQIFIH